MSIVFINPYRYDPDAEDYINRVIAADVAAGSTSGLEIGVQDAINAFVVGCKADGIWPAIKASCILAGAKTLAGALVPLVGTAPTNYNFVAGDYNRETGLAGDGSTKYLDSNRNNTADPQNSRHLAVYQTTPMTTDVCILIGSAFVTGRSTLVRIGNISARISAGTGPVVPGAGVAGFLGGARFSSTSTAIRNGGLVTFGSDVSEVPASAPLGVFAAGNGSTPSNPRLAFYSIGESLNLALLDARVTALVNAIGAAIP
jgi:hypothetical protein